MISTTYNNMWEEFCHALKHEQLELDAWIDNPSDTRRGITALAYLEQNNHKVCTEISGFVDNIKLIEPDQYFHPQSELHLTLLSLISCVSDFTLNDIDCNQFIDVFQQVLRDAEPIEIEFRGITASPSCIVIQGFPVTKNLAQLREKMRAQFALSDLPTTIDSRYRISTAHVSAIRFRQPVKDSKKLLDICETFRQHTFGTIRFSEFHLVFNNWYQNLSATQILSHKST